MCNCATVRFTRAFRHTDMIIQVFSKVHQVFQMIYRIEEVVDTAANTIHDWPNPTLAPDPGL